MPQSNHPPSFLQLHIIDAQDEANAKRMKTFKDCNKDYVAVIASIMQRCNSYATQFVSARDELIEAERRGDDVAEMYLKIDRRGKSKVFAKPSANENVAGFVVDQGD